MRSTAGAVLVLLGLCACLSAQESAIQIPLLDRSAKAAASGEAGAFLSGLDALGVNPAGLADAKREWNATYRAMPLDTSVNGMAIGVPIASIRTTLAVSYTALRSAGLERRDENGALQGEFRHEDQMAGLHAAAPFQWGPVAIDGGVSVKSIQSRIDRYSGSGLAVDAGLRHKFDGVPLTVAAAALNVGQGPQLLNERSALPTSYGLSAAYSPLPSVSLFGGGSYQPGTNVFNASVGGEVRVAHILALRGNYAGGTGAEGRAGLGQLVGGIGVYLGAFRLDYAFQPAGQDLAEAGAPATQHATLDWEF